MLNKSMNQVIKNCAKCGTEFDAYSKWGTKSFCSTKCGKSHPKTKEQREKISHSVKTSAKCVNARIKRKEEYTLRSSVKNCPICEKSFTYYIKTPKTYCSRVCYLKDSEHRYRPQTSGGYRPGSGRSKSGYYQGIYCGSTYELCWVIYNLDHNIKFTRFEGAIENQELKYYPDFLMDDKKTIVEIKGFERQESVDKKIKLAESFGYTVKVLRYDDLSYAFEYVKEKYTKEFRTLYDGYKPKYSVSCDFCQKVFETDRKIKTSTKFCSRKCVGKYNKNAPVC